MVKNITKEMTDELNEKLKEEGCNFYFRFEKYSSKSDVGVIHPRFINEKFLNLQLCRINTEGFRFVKNFFKTKGIDWLQETRSGGIIANQDNGNVF